MKIKASTILIFLFVVFGCSNTQINDSLTNIQGEKPVTIAAILATEKYHLEFANCLRNKLKQLFPDLEIMPESVFRDSMFPWLEHGVAPKEKEKLAKLFKKRPVIERMKKNGIEVVIFVHGYSITKNDKGFMAVGSGYGPGFAAFGYVSWDEESYLGTSVYSFRDETWLGESTVSSQGNSKMPAFILPIPILASTKSSVCDKTAELISKCLGRQFSPLGESEYR